MKETRTSKNKNDTDNPTAKLFKKTKKKRKIKQKE